MVTASLESHELLKGHLSVRNSTCRVESAEQSGGRQGAKRALISQESSKQPVGIDHLEGPSCTGDHQATKGAPTGLEATKRLSRRRVARKEPRSQKRRKRPPRAKRAPSTKGCRTDEGINHPGEQKVALRTKNSDGAPGGCFVDAQLKLWMLESGVGVLGHPQRDLKLHPWVQGC